MKLQLSLLSLIACISFAAAAQVTVEHMTCKQAQNFAKKYGRYYKDGGPDGAIPIWPVYQLDNVNCPGRTFTAPEMVRTLDVPDCIVGYYCNKF